MPRYALMVEYDGRPFSGWQWQDDRPSVQGAIEAALAKLERDLPRIGAAGRTDAGVHARGQVCQCDMARDWAPETLMNALNHHLKPAPVAIVAAAEVADYWHARFSALERRYLFRILNRRARATLESGQVWQVQRPLDSDAMREGATYLIGRHDFTTFRSTMCQAKSPVKTLDTLDIADVETEAGPEIRVSLSARSFLHNQVRSFVGTLEKVGSGSWPPERVGAALAARNRAACGPVAPPHGLYLTGVRYPEDPFAADGNRRAGPPLAPDT